MFGTLKRAFWVAYTYNQKNTNGRETIEGKYGRSCFLAFAWWKMNLLKVMAWRSGTGGVSLAMNSDNTGEREPLTIDFCFRTYSDGKWFKSLTISQGERNLKAFQREIELPQPHPEELESKIFEHLIEIASTKVKMLTVSDLDFSWFTLSNVCMDILFGPCHSSLCSSHDITWWWNIWQILWCNRLCWVVLTLEWSRCGRYWLECWNESSCWKWKMTMVI